MKNKNEVPETLLSAEKKIEITEFINKMRGEGMKDKAIKKEISKAFELDIDTTDYEFPVKEEVVNGSAKNVVKETPANLKEGKEPTTYQHKFTESEINEKSRMLANVLEEKSALEDRKKSVMKDFSAKIEEKNGSINQLSNFIRSGFEMRHSECEVVKDYNAGTKTYTLNGKVVKEEKMTTADYTLDFPDQQ